MASWMRIAILFSFITTATGTACFLSPTILPLSDGLTGTFLSTSFFGSTMAICGPLRTTLTPLCGLSMWRSRIGLVWSLVLMPSLSAVSEVSTNGTTLTKTASAGGRTKLTGVSPTLAMGLPSVSLPGMWRIFPPRILLSTV